MQNQATVTIKQLNLLLPKVLKAGLVPMIHSSPGLGKTSLVTDLAKKLHLELRVVTASMCDPTDIQGIPFKRDGLDKATHLPFDLFPLEDDPLPEGMKGTLLFLDELNHGKQSTAAALYRVILNKEVGNHKLRKNTFIVAAGNLDTDRAMIVKQSTATNSRLVHLYLVADINEWLDDVAYPQKFDSRVVSYLLDNKGDLHDFDPSKDVKTFCCPRTWEFVHKLIKNEPDVTSDMLPLIAGTISMGVATKFIRYCKIFADLPRAHEIIANPTGTIVSTDNAIRYGITVMLTDHANDDNAIKNSLIYLDRLGKTFVTVYCQILRRKNPDIVKNQDVRKILVEYIKEEN